MIKDLDFLKIHESETDSGSKILDQNCGFISEVFNKIFECNFENGFLLDVFLLCGLPKIQNLYSGFLTFNIVSNVLR